MIRLTLNILLTEEEAAYCCHWILTPASHHACAYRELKGEHEGESLARG